MTLEGPIPLPWRIHALPRWVEVLPGMIYFLSAFLKPFKIPQACGPDPWGLANAVLLPVEVLMAIALLLPRMVPTPPDLGPDHLQALVADRRSRDRADRRRMAGVFGALLSLGALGVLSYLHIFGPALRLAGADTSACGCFGPIPMPFAAHVVVLLVLAGCLGAVFLHEETVLSEERGRAAGLGRPGLEPGSKGL